VNGRVKLHLFGKHKEALVRVSILVILIAITGYAVAKTTPAQQPTTDKIIDHKVERPSIALKTPTLELITNVKQDLKGEVYTVTAYDLSVQSCGKPVGHPNYGKTATGYNLSGHTWASAKTIAVDPRFIPLGSKVLIKFLDEKFKKYNGIYTARDTGGAIKGYRIDFFIGDFEDDNASDITYAFGKRQAEVIVLS
jgi:3D (Asp-Asp-Asp) domain-containing protein